MSSSFASGGARCGSPTSTSLLARRGLHQARPAPVLRRRLAGAAAASPRPRAMVMKRYPNGIRGKWFFMKRAPSPRPEWIETCEIMHKCENLIAFPMVQDLASLLWVVNLGCIDLNPWYGRCDDVEPSRLPPLRPRPGRRARASIGCGRRRWCVRDALEAAGHEAARQDQRLGGNAPLRGHRARAGPEGRVALRQGARQASWSSEHPKLITTEFRVADRPRGRVLVDYNQNAWGVRWRRCTPCGPRICGVSTPVTWEEVERGSDRGLPARQRPPPGGSWGSVEAAALEPRPLSAGKGPVSDSGDRDHDRAGPGVSMRESGRSDHRTGGRHGVRQYLGSRGCVVA